MAPEDTQHGLAPLRQRIDEIDQELVRLLNQRAEVVQEIGQLKRTGNCPIYAPDRERRVLQGIRALNRGPLPNACLEAIWRELMSGSFALERPLRVGFLGPSGSFTHVAARRQFGASVNYDGLDAIASIFEEAARGHIDLGLVPIENSASGGIGETLDGFLDTSVRACAEVLLGVHHHLLARCPLAEARRVYSKPEVFSQCRKWLGAHLPRAERIPVSSSAAAAERAASEEGAAAIASSLSAELYGLDTLYANIEDNPSNVTRFLVIAPRSARATGDDKTAVMFTTAHKPGALANVLEVFSAHQINLTHIDKRPSRRANWEYCFFVDCVGHEEDPSLAEALRAVEGHCLQLTVLGSFPRATEVL